MTPPAAAMTHDRLEQILASLQDHMLLRDWKPWLDRETAADDGNTAQVHRRRAYKDALVRVAPEYPKWDEWTAHYLMAHELMHLHMRDLKIFVDDVMDSATISRDARALVDDQLSAHEEAVVDQLARVIANFMVPGPETTRRPGFDEDPAESAS